VYLPALQGEILGWDDAEIITHNYRIQYLSADTLLDIFRPVSRYGKPPFALYVPLTELSIACEYHLAGEAAWLYHLNNILLHALNSVLVALLVWRLFRDRLTALLTGALFAVHPLHVESVAWISERKDVLCVCFYLLALLAHVRWQAHGRWRSYLLVQLCGVLALLAKPLAMTLPAVLLLCDVYTRRLHHPPPAGSGINFKLFPLRWWRWLGLTAEGGAQPSAPGVRPQCAWRGVRWGVVLEKAPLALAALVITLLNVYQQHAHGAFITRHARSVFVNVLMACYGVCLYVIKTVLPVRLSPVYLQPQEVYLTDGITVLAVLVTCAVVVLAVAAWRRGREAGFALAFFCITLVPNSQLVPTGLNIFAADRFYYLPGIGLLYLLAYALRQGLRLPRWRALVAGGHRRFSRAAGMAHLDVHGGMADRSIAVGIHVAAAAGVSRGQGQFGAGLPEARRA